MTNCRFCSGKAINGYSVGNGIKTMKEMADAMFGISVEKDELDNGIILVNGNKMHIDNSSGEYDPVQIEIRYCPFCGIKLESKNKEKKVPKRFESIEEELEKTLLEKIDRSNLEDANE